MPDANKDYLSIIRACVAARSTPESEQNIILEHPEHGDVLLDILQGIVSAVSSFCTIYLDSRGILTSCRVAFSTQFLKNRTSASSTRTEDAGWAV